MIINDHHSHSLGPAIVKVLCDAYPSGAGGARGLVTWMEPWMNQRGVGKQKNANCQLTIFGDGFIKLKMHLWRFWAI